MDSRLRGNNGRILMHSERCESKAKNVLSSGVTECVMRKLKTFFNTAIRTAHAASTAFAITAVKTRHTPIHLNYRLGRTLGT